MSDSARDDIWMQEAIRQAMRAQELGDVPVGAVIVRDEQLVAAAFNRRIIDKDPTAHAEMLAIRQAAAALADWRLENCTLYVTLEPCPMCAGAIILARIPRVVYGASDPKAGAVNSLYRLGSDGRLNHQFQAVVSPLAGECGQLLTDFFKAQRAQGKK